MACRPRRGLWRAEVVGHPQRVHRPGGDPAGEHPNLGVGSAADVVQAEARRSDGFAVQPHAGHRLAQVEDRTAGAGAGANATVASPCAVPAAPSKTRAASIRPMSTGTAVAPSVITGGGARSRLSVVALV